MSDWQHVEQLPIQIGGALAVEQYAVTVISDATNIRHYGAATLNEAQEIATRMRATPLVAIVVIARIQDVWKKQ